jgi:hypothetical protein
MIFIQKDENECEMKLIVIIVFSGLRSVGIQNKMSHSELKISKKTKSVNSDYADPVNRHKLLGWANETLSKIKSDRNFLRKTVKKNKHGGKIANADYHMTLSKKDNYVEEEISELKTNDVATYVSEIVTSKRKKKTHHTSFDSSDKEIKKASYKEHMSMTEKKEHGDKQCKLKAKHRSTMLSCSEDQTADVYGHEETTEGKKKKKKKKKYEEDSYQNCSADTTISGDPLRLWKLEVRETPRKKQKLTNHSKSGSVSCHHCCNCASEEVKAKKKEMNTNDGTNMFDDMRYLSGTKKIKKHKMHSDLYISSKNESACFWEKVENSGPYKQDKKKRSKHTFDSVLEEGEQLSNEDAPKERSKKKKKEKRSYTHLFSEQFISEKKKLKKYKVYTQKYKCDESRGASEHGYSTGVGVSCDLSSATEESKAFKVHCVPHTKGERRKHKHDCCFNDKFEETENEKHKSCKTQYTSERSKQETNKENLYDQTVGRHKRKKKSEKHDTCGEHRIISEAKADSEPEPGKKKKRKKEERNCKDNENISNLEGRDKQKLYSDKNNINTVEISFMQEKQKKQRKKANKNKCDNLSVDAKKGSEREMHKKGATVDENKKVNEFMDCTLLDHASTNTKYSVERKDKTGNKRKSKTSGMEPVSPKKNTVSKETHGISAAIIQGGVMGYEESNVSPELTQTVKSLKENNKGGKGLTSICVNIHKNVLHGRNIKGSRNVGTFGLSPISRLLDTESEFRNSKHSCLACCRCKLHPEIRSHESCDSTTKDISNIVIKTEPGLIIKKEKEVVDSVDPHVVDKQLLGEIQDSQIELNTNYMNRADDSMKKTENSDASIDKLGRQERISVASGSGPNRHAAVNEDMHLNGTVSESGTVGCVEGFSDMENGNKEADMNTPLYNIYDDKITVKEEIFHLTNTHDDQSGGGNHEEGMLRENSEFVGEQDMVFVDNKTELSSVRELGDTAADVAGSPRVEEVGGSNLNTVPQYEPVSWNKLQSNCSLEMVPEAASIHSSMWNVRETGSSYWTHVNGNEHPGSQFFDVPAFTTGQVHFVRVPKW